MGEETLVYIHNDDSWWYNDFFNFKIFISASIVQTFHLNDLGT